MGEPSMIEVIAGKAGITRRQAQYYALWFDGMTHREIANLFGVRRSSISQTIGRAQRRNHSLPKPLRQGRTVRLHS
jgi:transposase